MRVFVYGSLKKTRGNHCVLELSDAKFIAECETVADNYLMYDFGCYPGVVPVEEGGTTIKGEVYEVTALDRLDCLEGYPDLYYREEMALSNGDTAWMYIFNQGSDTVNYQRVAGGTW